MIRIPLFVFLSFLVIFSDPGYGNDQESELDEASVQAAIRVIEAYPELENEEHPLSQAMLKDIEYLSEKNPDFFNQPDWQMKLARMNAERLNILPMSQRGSTPEVGSNDGSVNSNEQDDMPEDMRIALSEYPELQDENHPLSVLVLDDLGIKAENIPDFFDFPRWRLAVVKKHAEMLNILPLSKRKDGQDVQKELVKWKVVNYLDTGGRWFQSNLDLRGSVFAKEEGAMTFFMSYDIKAGDFTKVTQVITGKQLENVVSLSDLNRIPISDYYCIEPIGDYYWGVFPACEGTWSVPGLQDVEGYKAFVMRTLAELPVQRPPVEWAPADYSEKGGRWLRLSKGAMGCVFDRSEGSILFSPGDVIPIYRVITREELQPIIKKHGMVKVNKKTFSKYSCSTRIPAGRYDGACEVFFEDLPEGEWLFDYEVTQEVVSGFGKKIAEYIDKRDSYLPEAITVYDVKMHWIAESPLPWSSMHNDYRDIQKYHQMIHNGLYDEEVRVESWKLNAKLYEFYGFPNRAEEYFQLIREYDEKKQQDRLAQEREEQRANIGWRIKETSAGTFRLYMSDGRVYRLRQRSSTGRFVIYDDNNQPIGSIREASTGRLKLTWD